MSQAHIERYFQEACLLPALKAIGQSRQIAARSDMLPHHEPYFEIHLLMAGSLHWWVEDEVYSLEPGSVYVTKPGELHGAVKNTVQPCTLTWLQVDAEALQDHSLSLELAALSSRHWPGAADLTPYVSAMLTEIRQPQADSIRFIDSYLRLFLAKFLRQYRSRQNRSVYPEQFARLLAFIEDALAEGRHPGVNDLCLSAGLSRSRIFQLFNAHSKQSPISYINTRRIEHAKYSLKEQKVAITRLALDLGYSSSQHFATDFKRKTGMTPQEYRRLESLKPLAEEKEFGKHNLWGHEAKSEI